MKRILAAVDFSDASKRALRSAFELSRCFGAELRVVHVLPMTAYDGQRAELGLTRGAGGLKQQHDLHQLVSDELRRAEEKPPSISQKLLEGKEHTEILEDAERWDASLIVLGSHDRSAVDRLFSGSVSSKVISRATRSVLMVHGPGPDKPTRILAAVDGGKSSALVLATASNWAAVLQAQLSHIHVLKKGSELYLKQAHADLQIRLASELSKPLPPIEWRIGTPDREICSYASETQQDLLIVGAHHKHGFLDFGNTAARVAHHCPCSVLVVRE